MWAAEPAAEGDDDGPLVRTESCEHLDSEELVRLTRLEIGSNHSLEVAYRCDERHIVIAVTESARGLSVSRQLPRDCCDAAAERTLALLAAGLHAVAAPLWSARVKASPPAPAPSRARPAPPPAPLSVAPPAPVFADRPATTRDVPSTLAVSAPPRVGPPIAATPLLVPPPSVPSVGEPPPAATKPVLVHQLIAGAQVRFYNVTSGLTSYGARLQYLYSVSDDFALGPVGEADFGSLSRDGGSITTRVFHLGASGSWRFARGGWAQGTLAPFAVASFVQLEGSAADPSVQGSTISGLTGAGGVRLGAILGKGPLRLSATGEGGLLFRAPRGQLADQSQVQLDGLWLGVGLAVDLGWGGRVRPASADEAEPAEAIARGRS